MILNKKFILLFIISFNYSCNNITSSPNKVIKNIDIQEKIINKDTITSTPSPNIKELYLKNVVVIYKNEYFVRVDEKNNKLKENNKVDIVKLTELLEEYKIKKMIDSTTSEDVEELDRRQKINSESTGIDVSHVMSIHYYYFPKEIDTLELCEKLKKFPFVLKAYPEMKGVLF